MDPQNKQETIDTPNYSVTVHDGNSYSIVMEDLKQYPQHKLVTVEDIFRVVTDENVMNLSQDIATVLQFYLHEKKVIDKMREEELLTTGKHITPLRSPPSYIDWIDDGKNSIHATFSDGEQATFTPK